MCYNNRVARPHSQAAKTSPSHGEGVGSIPAGVTKTEAGQSWTVLLLFCPPAGLRKDTSNCIDSLMGNGYPSYRISDPSAPISPKCSLRPSTPRGLGGVQIPAAPTASDAEGRIDCPAFVFSPSGSEKRHFKLHGCPAWGTDSPHTAKTPDCADFPKMQFEAEHAPRARRGSDSRGSHRIRRRRMHRLSCFCFVPPMGLRKDTSNFTDRVSQKQDGSSNHPVLFILDQRSARHPCSPFFHAFWSPAGRSKCPFR